MLAWLHQGESDVFSSRYLSTPQTSYIIRVRQGKRSLDAIAEQAGLVRWSAVNRGGPEKSLGSANGKPVTMGTGFSACPRRELCAIPAS